MEEHHGDTENTETARVSTASPCLPCLRGFAVVLVFTLVVRCGILLCTPDALLTDPDDYLRLATNLVKFDTLGAGNEPTAYRPPLYPIALTGCVALGEDNRGPVLVAIGVLHVLLRAPLPRFSFWFWGDGGDWDAAAPCWPRCSSPAIPSYWTVRVG